tara:strand:- start:113 stop:343 length:231 start_codon:yes stop_codon:yes gene_type:complete
MIHASKLFPIAMDRIRDQIERGHATQTAKARALLDAFDEGEKRGKRSVRNAADRGAIRVKRKEKRARAKQLTLNLK